MSALDKQVGGNHYKQFKIQPTEFIHANGIGFIPGNVIKYACRAGLKDEKRQEIEKIIHYCELWLDLDEANTSTQPRPMIESSDS